ncbi:TonB-dependent receptor [Croceibacterium sp. LX-88]|uniref:TonB-dependent receptor n=1 Tax=Croceibacterium selenioxidans TaxID=2838833 RepID=A0ABS5W7S5_9SPHN|nr:TonB-dependent receptor [Croceibacterium selenioxidans]MBT2135367.1 TonB-dependent receptor [Croceibacterium selenioxidans]
MKKSGLLIGSAVLALATGLAATHASAQDTAAVANEGETILVTAQKRSQELIEVPQSVTVVSGSTLEEQHADSFSDYLKLVPGLQLDQSRPGQGRLILRGVNTEGVASTIGIYMDETPFGSSSGLVNGAVLAADFDTFDLDRIEVLRGPQGTFYGASSLSGVLKFVTTEPSTSETVVRGRAGVELTKGGAASGYGNLVVNVPISSIAAFRASGSYRTIGGFIDSVGAGGSDVEKNIDGSKSFGGRASLLVMPSEAIDLRFTAVIQNIDADAPSLAESDPETLEMLHGGYTQSQFIPGFSDLRYRVYNATGNFDLGFGTLTSSTSYGTQKQSLRTDYTFALSPLIEAITTEANEFFQDQSTDSEKFTQELRLTGESTLVDWLVGLYYTDEDGLIEQDFIASTPGTTTPITGLPTLGYALVESSYREAAAFANLTWHVADGFDIDLGGRYSDNKQSAHQVTDGLLVGGFQDLPVFESKENVFTYSIAPRFELSDNASIYARVASGFRPGGPNVLAPNQPLDQATYDSDSLTNYELGLKAQTPDRKYGIEVAIFHIDWNDIQLLAEKDGFNFNANGGGAKIDGLELTATATPAADFNLSLNTAYTDARLSTDTLIGGLDGDRLPFTPKFSASLNGDYTVMVGNDVEAYFGGSLRYLSDQSASFDADYRAAHGEQRTIEAYAVIDLNAGITIDQFDIQLYVKNLTSSAGRTSTTGTTVFGGFPLFPDDAIGTGVIRPRTVGLSVRAEF